MKVNIVLKKHTKVAGLQMMADIADAANGAVDIHFDDYSYITAILQKKEDTTYSFTWRD